MPTSVPRIFTPEVDGALLVGQSTEVPLRLALLPLLLLLPLAAACGQQGRAESITIVVNTPAPTPTPAPSVVDPADLPELLLSASTAYQGGAILVSLTGNVRAGTVTFLGRQHELTQGDQSIYAYVGIAIEDAPGSYPLTVTFQTPNGSEGSLTETIEILETAWTVDSLTFEDGQAESLLDPAVVAQENAILAEAYSADSPTKQWTFPWLVPTDGPVTAVFGEQRSINGGPPGGHHGGTDIGAPEGQPVVATSGGTVVLARLMDIHGNMVVIDHGGGVFSSYGHLVDFVVAEGQQVAPGELIGHVGNTGLSTGAHLHWEIAIDGVLVDAWRFVDGTNGF